MEKSRRRLQQCFLAMVTNAWNERELNFSHDEIHFVTAFHLRKALQCIAKKLLLNLSWK
jgi:hypothetical protein